MKASLAAALYALSLPIAQACEPGLAGADVQRVESARYLLAFRTQPARVIVSEHFAVDVAVCAKHGSPLPESVQIDAHMPAHRHGMNYEPVLQKIAAGRWRAEGLLFHMPGQWEFRFDVRAAGVTDRLTHRYPLD